MSAIAVREFTFSIAEVTELMFYAKQELNR